MAQIPLVIAEIAQTHDGSLGQAHAFIDAVARTGADAIKFQTHIAAAESTLAEPWRVKFSRQDANRYDYWKRMEFTPEQWQGLKDHATEKNLLFISSPFSIQAVELLEKIGVYAWKIASGEISNLPLLDRMAISGLPFWVSTGMSRIDEIDRVVTYLHTKNLDFTLMQCTSMYPVPPEKVGLNMLLLYRERYGCRAGLSDHSGTIFPGLAAVTLGASLVEVHVTMSREMFGPDVPASITTTELKQLVEGARFIYQAMTTPMDKDGMAENLSPMRSLFSKSIVAQTDLKAGTVLMPEHLTTKKPGTGLSPDHLSDVLGRRLLRDLAPDEMLRMEDVA